MKAEIGGAGVRSEPIDGRGADLYFTKWFS